MSDVPDPVPVSDPSPEDLARMLAASGFGAPPPGRSARSKIVAAVLIAGVGVGASVLSCVGQTFTLRQARALEGIEQQLQSLNLQLQQGCSVDAAKAAK